VRFDGVGGNHSGIRALGIFSITVTLAYPAS